MFERLCAADAAKSDKGAFGWLIDSILARGRGNDSRRRMELLETLSLGGKRQLMLVVCDGVRFLIGTSGDGVQTIVSLDGIHQGTVEQGNR